MLPKIENKIKQEVALVQKAVVQVESVSRTRVKKMRKER